MHCTVKRRVLVDLLTKALLGLPKRTTLPSAAWLRLEAVGGYIIAACYDLEVAVRATGKAQVAQEGMIALETPKDFLAALKAARAEDVELTAGKGLHVQAGSVTWDLELGNIDNLPPLPVAQGQGVPADGLVGGLSRVLFAAATDNTRPVLTTVCVTPGEGGAVLAAADGFRLAVSAVEGLQLPSAFLLPQRMARVLVKLLPSVEGVSLVPPVQQGVKLGVIQVEAPGLMVLGEASSGTYPNYSQLIPVHTQHTVLERRDLAEAVKVVGADKNTVIVRLQAEGGSMVVSARVDEKESSSRIPAQGDPLKIAFNPSYLLDLLRVLGERVAISFASPSDPAVFQTEGDDQTTYVLMPMFVHW